MVSGISTFCFLPQRLHPGLLDALHASGAQALEVFAGRWHFDYADRAQVREVAAWFQDHPVIPSLGAPLTADTHFSRHASATLTLLDRDKTRRITAMDEIKRALEAAELIPFATCSLALGTRDEPWSESGLEHALTAVEHLRAFAAPLGVQLLLENLQSEMTTPEHLLEILRIGHFDSVGVCLDLGHAHLTPGGAVNAFEVLGPRVRELHVHDNHGISHGSGKDEHLAPGEGTLDWAEVWRQVDALAPARDGKPVRAILELSYETGETPAQITAKAANVWSERCRALEQAARTAEQHQREGREPFRTEGEAS